MKKILLYGLVLMLMLSFGFAQPTDDLVSYWDMEENTGGTTADEVWTNDLTLTNYAWDTSTSGSCGDYSIDLTNGYMRDTSTSNMSNTAFTFNIWSKSTVSGGTGIVGEPDNSISNYAWFMTYANPGGELLVNTYDGSANPGALGTTQVNDGDWHMLTVSIDTNITVYVDGVREGSVVNTANIAPDNSFTIGAHPYSLASSYSGEISNAMYWDRVLDHSEIVSVYENESTGTCYPWSEDAPEETLVITAQNTYDNSTINDFNVTLPYNSTVFTTNNGTVHINITAAGGNLTLTQNVTVIGNYSWPSIYNDWNISDILVANLTESEITFDFFQVVTNESLEGYVYDNYSNQTNGTSFDFSYGEHTVLIHNVSGHFDLNFTFDVTRQQNATVNVTGIYDALLKINATDAQTGADINTFNITLRGLNNSLDDFGVTASGDLYFGVKKGLNYTAIVNDTLHAVTEANVTANETYSNLTIEISSVNSVLMTFVDEFTNTIISGVNMTALFVGANSYTYTTTDGTIFAELITPSDYEIRYYSTLIDDYKLRSYFFTLTNLSFNNLTLYSLNTSSTEFTKATITFQILDPNFAPVEDARVVVQRYYSDENGFVTVWQRNTNSEGEAVGEFETVDAFYRYLVYYNDNLEFASTTNGVQFTADDTLTIYIDTAEDIFSGIQSILDLADVSNLDFISTGNFTGYFELNYTNDNLIQVCMEVSTLSEVISIECQTTASGTIQSSINAPTTRTTAYFARAMGYDVTTGQFVTFDTEGHTFNFEDLLGANEDINSAATFVVVLILMALALLLVKFPVISVIAQTVFFIIVTISPLPLVVGGATTTIAWLVSLALTGIFILLRGKNA